MSGNAIQIDEVALNNIRSDYKQPFMAHPQKVRKVRRSAATATEESESASVAQFQRQERGRTAQYLEIGFRF